jgi:hypothetical protein
MTRRLGLKLFLPVLIAVMLFQYAVFFKPGKSLYLAYFYDPSPRLCWYPWMVESARQIRQGHFPLWCSLEGAGMPLLANTGSAPLHPFNLVFEIFPYLRLLDYVLMLRLFLLGLFSYLFAIELGLSPLAAAFSALTICFSGYVSRNINYILLNNDIWLPAALLLAERMAKNRARLHHFALLVLFSALEMLGGSPQSALYVFALVFLYLLIRGRKPRKELLALVLALGLGCLLVSAQLLSSVEYLGYAWTAHDPRIHFADRGHVSWMFSLFFPWLFGNAHADPQRRLLPAYIGLVPVFLALATVPRLKRLPASALCFWMVLPVLAGIIFYLPPYSGWNYLPVVDRMRNARSAYFGMYFSLAMLAGFGLDDYLKGRLSLKTCAISLAFTFAFAGLALALALLFPANPLLRIQHHASWLVPAAFFAVVAAVGLAGVKSARRQLAGFFIAALGLANLVYLARGLAPVADIQLEIWRFKHPAPPPILQPIMADPARVRFFGIHNVFQADLNILFGINDLRVFEALRPESYAQAMAEIEGFPMRKAFERFVKDGWDFEISEPNINHPLLSRLGAKYLLSDREVSGPHWQLISRTQDVWLYQNQEAWPRSWLIQSNGASDFERAGVADYRPDRVTMQIKSPGRAELVLADQYAPGWRAFSDDGQELRIFLEQGLFRKVALEKGDQTIRFLYQPVGFEIGLFASMACLCSCLCLAALWLARQKGWHLPP